MVDEGVVIGRLRRARWLSLDPAPADGTHFYWMAEANFVPPDDPAGPLTLALAVDRHYHLFLNGTCLARVTNYHHGNEAVRTQLHTVPAGAVRGGENRLQLLVRTDLIHRKNHVPFRAGFTAVLMHAKSEHNLLPDDPVGWRANLVNGWREQTIPGDSSALPYERVTLLPSPHHHLPSARLTQVSLCFANQMPVLLPPDRGPKMRVVSAPQRMAVLDCVPQTRAFVFPSDERRRFSNAAQEQAVDLVIHADADVSTSWALSKGIRFRFSRGEDVLFANDEVEDAGGQNCLKYLLNYGTIQLRRGANEFRLLLVNHRNSLEEPVVPDFRFAVDGMGADVALTIDGYVDGQQVALRQAPISSQEAYGCLASPTAGAEPSWMPAGEAILSPGQSLVWDFGVLQWADLRVALSGTSGGCRIGLSYGFSMERGGLDTFRMGLGMTDELVVTDTSAEFDTFEPRVFRFVQLYLPTDAPGTMRVGLAEASSPRWIDQPDVFLRTSDPLVNRIWEVANRTAICCTEAIYMDNPEREHTQWIECASGLAAVGYVNFGEYEKPATFFEEVSSYRFESGELPGHAPGRWKPRRPLQDHMALWVLGLERHYDWTGDAGFLRRRWPDVIAIAEHFQRHMGDSGLVQNLEAAFLDWGVHHYSYVQQRRGGDPWRSGILTAVNLYAYAVLRVAARFGQELGDSRSDVFASAAASLRGEIVNRLYDPSLGLFRDGIENPLADGRLSEVSSLLAGWFRVLGGDEDARLMRRLMTPPAEASLIPASAHFIFQMGSALLEHDLFDPFLDLCRRGFGHMLKKGATTFWESWSDEASQCQATGATPAYLISYFFSGIRHAAPGFKAIRLVPVVCSLESFSAKLTLPQGLAEVTWRSGARPLYRLVLPPTLRPSQVDASALQASRYEAEILPAE
jgi:hypothetical protein